MLRKVGLGGKLFHLEDERKDGGSSNKGKASSSFITKIHAGFGITG